MIGYSLKVLRGEKLAGSKPSGQKSNHAKCWYGLGRVQSSSDFDKLNVDGF